MWRLAASIRTTTRKMCEIGTAMYERCRVLQTWSKRLLASHQPFMPVYIERVVVLCPSCRRGLDATKSRQEQIISS